MNAIQFIKDYGIENAREVVSGAPETATHFTEALGGHYAKEGMLKMKQQWLWFNSINKEWYYDFAAKDHIHLPDLKRFVESVHLVGEYGGLYGARDFISGYSEEQLAKPIYSPMLRLKQAIADYEAIYRKEDA